MTTPDPTPPQLRPTKAVLAFLATFAVTLAGQVTVGHLTVWGWVSAVAGAVLTACGVYAIPNLPKGPK